MHDDDTVLFAFSQPYTYTQILKDIFDKEDLLQPTEGIKILKSFLTEDQQ
jgi:hypothetical protein